MAIKWTEVIQKPEFQSLGPLEKHQAQEQYFNEQVAPQLSAEEANPARNQFFTEFPTEFGKAINEHVAVSNYNESAKKYRKAKESFLYGEEEVLANPNVIKDSVKGSVKMITEQTPFGIPIAIGENVLAPIPSIVMEGATGISAMSPQIIGAKKAYDVVTGKKTLGETAKEALDPRMFLNTSKEIIDTGHELQQTPVLSKITELAQPKTKYGGTLLKGASYPLEKGREWAEDAQSYWEERGHYNIGFVNKMLLEALPYAAGYAVKPVVGKIIKEAKARGTSPIKVIEEMKQNSELIKNKEVISDAVQKEGQEKATSPSPEYVAGRVPMEDLPEGLKPKGLQTEGFPEGFSAKKVSTGTVNAYGDKAFKTYEYEIAMPDGKTFNTSSLKDAKEFANNFKDIVDSIQKENPTTKGISKDLGEIKNRLSKPAFELYQKNIADVGQDMIGVPSDSLKHPLLSKEMGQTLLEKATEESKAREIQKQEMAKQGKLYGENSYLSIEPYQEPLGEAGYIKIGKGKDIPDVDIKKVVSKDINPLEQGLTTLHVADRHPFMKPAVETAIKATQDTNHAVKQRIDKLSGIFDKAEGKPFFGLVNRRSSGLRNVDSMVEGKIPTPHPLKEFIKDIKDFLGEERQRVIENQKQEILSKATKSQKDYLRYLSEGGKEPQVKGTVKQAAHELQAAILEADKWGQTDYFPRSMAGDYYYLGSDGKILSIGKTPKQAKFNLMERLENNPELKGSTVYFVNGLKSMLSTRHSLNPELRGTLEQIGVALPRKKFFGLLNKIEKMVDAKISEAGVGDVKGVNVDLKGVAKMQSNKKFAGNLLKRHTEMRGQEADPFKTLSTYTAAVERNLGLSNAKKYLISFEEKLPPHMENSKTYIRKLRENMLGYYDLGNKLVDQTIGKKIGAKPYILNRILQKGQSLTANLTLGFAPVKSLLNYVDATLLTVTKTGAKHWGNGVKMLFTKEGKALINEIGHLAGLEESFAYSHKVGAQKPNIIKPMGLYQFAELKGRTQSLAAAYQQGLEFFKGDKIRAKEHAVNIARLTQGLYDVSARPVAIRGAVVSTAYQFKQFINNKARFLSSLTPKQMAFYIPSIVSLYGTRGIWLTLKSIIGITLISDLLGNIGEKTNEELNKKYPKLHRGLFGLAGIDVSAPGTVQLPTEFKDWAGKFYVDTFKSGQMIIKGLKNNGWTDEEIASYTNSVAPVGYNIYKGLQLATTGKIKAGGKVMYKGSPYEAIANLAGAKTVKQSQAQDTIRYENDLKQTQTDKMAVIKDNILSSKTGKQLSDNISKAIEVKGIKTDKELEDFEKGLLNEMIKNNLTAQQRVFMTLPKNIKRAEIRGYQK